MWKPASVVPEHRRRAKVVWGTLLLAILGYTTWQIVGLAQNYADPNTNFSVSDGVYNFPIVDVCVWEGEGCDASRATADCIGSASFTVYDPCSVQIQDVLVEESLVTYKGNNCLSFDLSNVDLEGFAGDCSPSKKPHTRLIMSWTSSLAPDEEEDFRAGVGVFLGNESVPEYLKVPYSRVVGAPGIALDEVTYTENYLTFGQSTRTFIQGDSVTSYPTLSLSTVDFIDQNPAALDITSTTSDDGTYARGTLDITLTQGAYSLTELSDINPLDAGAFLGNIGGFWELLLVIWGIFFIAARAESPTHKGRNFAQPIQRGKEIVSRKRRRTVNSTNTASPDSEGGGEEQAYWSATGRDPQKAAPDGSTRAFPTVGARPSTVVARSSFRRPVLQDYPRRSSSTPIHPVVASESSFATSDRTSPRQPSELTSPRQPSELTSYDECV